MQRSPRLSLFVVEVQPGVPAGRHAQPRTETLLFIENPKPSDSIFQYADDGARVAVLVAHFEQGHAIGPHAQAGTCLALGIVELERRHFFIFDAALLPQSSLGIEKTQPHCAGVTAA